jgi:hypothetical protein
MEPLNRDPYLWQKAKARAKFQSHLVVYLVVNAGMWTVWALTNDHHRGEVPWPIWATAFWGLGLVMRGIAAYGGLSREQRTQREYERLVREQGSSDALDRYR